MCAMAFTGYCRSGWHWRYKNENRRLFHMVLDEDCFYFAVMIEYINNKFVWKRTTTQGMGQVFADIELFNADDMALARRNFIGEDEIRKFSICPLVDSGADHLCINENIQKVLQLNKVGTQRLELATGKIVTCDLVGPIELRFKNLRTVCDAVVLPADSDPLLGLLPLESLDVIIHPKRNELIENPHLHRI